MQFGLFEDENPSNRATELGINALTTREALTLLFHNVPRHKPDELADLVMASWPSLADLQRATLSELMAIGLTKPTAQRIQAALLLGRRAALSAVTERPQIKTPADVAAAYMPEMIMLQQEEIHVVMLDTRNRVIAKRMVYRGGLNSASLRIADLFAEPVRMSAASIILIHNHPSGDPAPSGDDVHVTREVIKAGKLLEIDVLDHLVIGHNRFTSLKERGMGFE